MYFIDDLKDLTGSKVEMFKPVLLDFQHQLLSSREIVTTVSLKHSSRNWIFKKGGITWNVYSGKQMARGSLQACLHREARTQASHRIDGARARARRRHCTVCAATPLGSARLCSAPLACTV